MKFTEFHILSTFAASSSTHTTHCVIELSQPKPVYWPIFDFPVFHVLA